MSKLAHSNQETMDAIERNAMKNDAVEHCQCPACQDGSVHDSDCAVHNGPAYPIGPCDCSLQKRTIPQEMIDRFLSWPLPIGFSPDCGISFDGRGKDVMGYEKQWPVGTNLFSAEQARNMLEHVVAPTLRYERLLLSNAEKEIAERAAPHPASQPDTVAVPIQTLHVSLQVLTFLKAVLIGQGYQKDSSSIHQLEIAYSMLRAAQEAK